MRDAGLTMEKASGAPPVTLATIAARLGVSRSTVSNAYNHPDQLSPALREKIFDLAQTLGYTGPDPVARRLRQRKAGAIGVLFAESLQKAFADAASALFLEGVAIAGEKTDSGMLLIPARPTEENAQAINDAIVDGFILYSIPPGHPFVEAALRRHVPVVCVDQTKIGGVSWVGIDDLAASAQAAQHLVDLNHRRIAVVVFGLNTNAPADEYASTPSVSRLRLQGYRRVLETAGISWSDVPIVECVENTESAGAAAAHRLFEGSGRPTAILCTSDPLALGVMRAARDYSIPVPSQLSVIGFNDLPMAANAEPPLTTVRQPLVEKGIEAARLLVAATQVGEKGNVQLEATLVVRESTAPCPAVVA
jgi:DNA-binding LacI/PurR family transcriptional regulator